MNSSHQCRSMLLVAYFGEKTVSRCGVCDYCRELNKLELNEVEINNFQNRIFQILENGPCSVIELVEKGGLNKHEKALELISWMVDQQLLKYNGSGQIVKFNH